MVVQSVLVQPGQNHSFVELEYVKNKATKAARKIPDDFPEVKHAFLQRVKSEVETWNIPHALIINWDQTESKLVPVSEWTMEREGTKQVPIIGQEDKREVLFLCL